MSLRVTFRRDARAEFTAAVRYYELEAPGVGVRFKTEVLAKIELIKKTPNRFGLFHGDVRRIRLEDFPYAIYFRTDATRIRILSVFHMSRDPSVWQSRADEESDGG